MVTTLQEKIDNWVFTLVGGDSGFDKFILELHKQPELAQIIPCRWHAEQRKSCLAADMQNSPNHALPLTCRTAQIMPYHWHAEDLWARHYNCISRCFCGDSRRCSVVTIENNYYCMLFDTSCAGVTSFKDAWSVMVWEASSLVVLCN